MEIARFATQNVYKVLVVNPRSFFDWLTFLVGGAVGAAIILGLERLLDWRQELARKKHITDAMTLELENNLKLCATIIRNIEADDGQPYTYSRFGVGWMEKYSETCIDYANDDSTRLQSFIYGAKASIQQLESTQDSLLMLLATSRALSNFSTHIRNYNQAVLSQAKQLDATLEVIKARRKGNKVFKDDTSGVQN